MLYYVCKYTPIEMLRAFCVETAVLDKMADRFDKSDAAAHANLCGFGKSVLQAVLDGEADELVLVNCCDVMRRVYDILKTRRCCRFLFMLDLPHTDEICQRRRFAGEITRLKDSYETFCGHAPDIEMFMKSFSTPERHDKPYAAIIGARAGRETEALASDCCDIPIANLTCVGNRNVPAPERDGGDTFDNIMPRYAASLLGQIPCRRMADSTGRRALFEDPNLRGVIYHTIKFCDYYGMEYAAAKHICAVPMTKIETDFTQQSSEQLKTRLEAFSETLNGLSGTRSEKMITGKYYAGIDSGSTSTDAVIIDRGGAILGTAILPTGGRVKNSADDALSAALKDAKLERGEIGKIVTTGYGRENIRVNGEGGTITEISCHAHGAHRLYPDARTIIDIGGQDSKAIRIDENGKVLNFAMNDKCAAGTGRFIEMMARALGLTMEEISLKGLDWHEDIVISSMCTVFAESEVVSLVAQEKSVNDIIHGLNNSVAARIAALTSRVGAAPEFMITGGVAQNEGVVRALEERLQSSIYVCPEAQLCGALGAALFAAGL